MKSNESLFKGNTSYLNVEGKGPIGQESKSTVFVISCSKDQNHHPLPKLALLTDVEKASQEVN